MRHLNYCFASMMFLTRVFAFDSSSLGTRLRGSNSLDPAVRGVSCSASLRHATPNVIEGNAPPALSFPVVELITPEDFSAGSGPEQLLHSVGQAIAGGVSLVQLRDNISSADDKFKYASRLRNITMGSAWFVVNGDPSLARSCGADGVHFPERMIQHAKELANSGRWLKIIGCSVHSVEKALEAAQHGADYIQVGTMFATQSHPGKSPEGIALLRRVRHALQSEGYSEVLIIGVGGINTDNCSSIVEAGGDGVAVIRHLCGAEDPRREALRLREALVGGAVASTKPS